MVHRGCDAGGSGLLAFGVPWQSGPRRGWLRAAGGRGPPGRTMARVAQCCWRGFLLVRGRAGVAVCSGAGAREPAANRGNVPLVGTPPPREGSLTNPIGFLFLHIDLFENLSDKQIVATKIIKKYKTTI